MTVFAVIPVQPKNLEKLSEAVTANFENNFLKLNEECWLISSGGTAQEVSQKLGILTGTAGSGVVLSVSGYFGRANPNVWTWMKAKLEKGPDA